MLLEACILQAQELPTQDPHILDSISLADVPAKAPGIATAIIQNGSLVYSKIAGYADFQDSSTISESSLFNIASNGKQFTAMFILLLEEKGLLSLDHDIRQYFPSLFPGIKSPIRIRQLLNHSSGIRDVYDLWSLLGITWWQQTYSNADALHLLSRQQELNFSPGSDYLYSNSNYILLACLVEKLTGQPFSTYSKKVFQQLGMKESYFVDSAMAVTGPVARAYFNFNTWTTYPWNWKICGDGNLFTSLQDQVRWEQIMQGSVTGGISPAILKKLNRPVGVDASSYGYGLEFGQYNGLPYSYHEGATGAWKATLIRVPEKKLSLLTFTNSGKVIPSQQTRQLLDYLLSEGATKQAIAVSKPAYSNNSFTEKELIGLYLTDNFFSFEFLQKENDFYLRRYGRNDVLLDRVSGQLWRQRYDSSFQLEFTRNKTGTFQVTAYHPTHTPYTLVKNSFPGLKMPYTFSGTYSNKETGVQWKVIKSSRQSFQLVMGTDTTSVRFISATTGLAGEDQLRLRIANGKVKEIFLNRQRLRNIRFSTAH
jgi:CubicO group peptidase (beta-lactamase class C family)